MSRSPSTSGKKRALPEPPDSEAGGIRNVILSIDSSGRALLQADGEPDEPGPRGVVKACKDYALRKAKSPKPPRAVKHRAGKDLELPCNSEIVRLGRKNHHPEESIWLMVALVEIMRVRKMNLADLAYETGIPRQTATSAIAMRKTQGVHFWAKVAGAYFRSPFEMHLLAMICMACEVTNDEM